MTSREFYAKHKGKFVKYTGGTAEWMALTNGQAYKLIGYYSSVDCGGDYVALEDPTRRYGAAISNQRYMRGKLPGLHKECRAYQVELACVKAIATFDDAGKKVKTPMGNGKVILIDEDNMVCVELDDEKGSMYEFRSEEVIAL